VSLPSVLIPDRVSHVFHEHLSNLAHNFQSRTSMFLKRVTLFRHGRRNSEEKKSSMSVSMPLRSARSVDVGRKDFGMSQPVLDIHAEQTTMESEDRSDASGSPNQSGSRLTSSGPHPAQLTPPIAASPSSPTTSDRNPPLLLSGLPTIDTSPLNVTIDGLPSTRETVLQPAPANSSVGPIVKSSSGVASGKGAVSVMTESESRVSDEVSCNSSDPFRTVGYSIVFSLVIPQCKRCFIPTYRQHAPRPIKDKPSTYSFRIHRCRRVCRASTATYETQPLHAITTTCSL
jgi:hypothetical protein